MSDKHGADFQIIERNPNVWLASCRCETKFMGDTYEAAEDKWRKHVYETAGDYLEPMGAKSVDRWQASSLTLFPEFAS